MLLSLAAFSAFAATASAHATFQELWVNGVDQGGWCVRLPQSNNPVTSVTSNVSSILNIICIYSDVLTSLSGCRLQCQRTTCSWQMCRARWCISNRRDAPTAR